MGDAIPPDAKATGAGGAEGVDRAVVKGHPPQKEEGYKNHRHGDVDTVEDHGGVPHLGHQLANHRAGAFRPHNVDAAPPGKGNNRQQKHQHPHPPHPMGEAAPEEEPPAHPLHIGEDAGPGGGEAGDGFKDGVDVAGDSPCKDEGQRPHQGHNHPGEGGDHKPFFGVNNGVLRLFEGKEQPRPAGDKDGCQHGHQIPLPAEEGHQGRQAHQNRLRLEDGAQYVNNHSIVHTGYSPALGPLQDVAEVLELVPGGDDDDVVPFLDGVVAAGVDNLLPPDDAGDKQVLPGAQVL